MDKKISSTDVGERINDTKKEIAQLSEELERLINSNAGLNNINVERGTSDNMEPIKCIQTEMKLTKTGNEGLFEVLSNKESSNKKTNVSIKTTIAPEAKTKTKSDIAGNTKSITQTKEATREFMRLQREKREEQRKKIDSKNKIDLELKKQKLLELQQKSLALVQRNLQLKRERSKSRERRDQIRIDKSNSGSNLGVPPLKKQNDILAHKKPDVQSRQQARLPDKLVKIRNDYSKPITSNCKNLKISNKSRLTKSANERKNSDNSQNADLCTKDLDLAARKIQGCYKDYLRRKQSKEENNQQKHQKEKDPVKESKETQTSTHKQIEFPTWLQPPSIDPYPCNFINTIKKKLQLVVNSPIRSKDIGVQSSIMETKSSIQKFSDNKRKYSEENSRFDEKIDYHSQKATNLDADALQHFALKNFREKFSQNIKEQFKTDSESDTSKNIPEISTESGVISDSKPILVSETNDEVLSINTDKFKNLTLRRPMKDMSKKSYTFNFSEEHSSKNSDMVSEKIQTEESHSKKLLRSPRDSIISFNISNDSETMTSIVSQKEKQNSEATSIEEIKTENSKRSHSDEKESFRKKLIFTPKQSYESNKSDGKEVHNSRNNLSKDNSQKHDTKKPSSRTSLKTHSASEISGEKSYSSHLSSRTSEVNTQESKLKNSIEKPKHDFKSPSFTDAGKYSDKLSNDNNTDSSEVIKTSSMKSLISTSSSKFSNPSNLAVPSEVNAQNEPDVKIQSLLNSLVSNKSKTSNSPYEVNTSLSEASNLLKMSAMVSDEHDENSSLSINNTNKSVQKQKFHESSQSKGTENSSHSIENKVNSQVVKDFKSRVVQSKSDTNEIHLKFEAEVHLLNDFNESLKQFMAVEKAFESLKNKNESSFRNSSKNSSALIFSGDSKISTDVTRHIGSTINTSRGSDLDESYIGNDYLIKSHLKSTNNLELSSMQKSTMDSASFSFNENIPHNLAGLSIKMFEQFIKDEDIRIENLKTIIKIREQALLDRTKGELAWLEIQRKHLKETGKLHEASLVKKKQRGILLKHQQERREMQRLKQLQKIQSNERKTILKEQKNLIKAKLTSEKLMAEMKMQTPRKQRPSGPLKVLKTSESHSETSLSRIASEAEEIYSITSRSRSVKLSEVDSSREFVFKQEETDIKKISANEDIDRMKKALLVRQSSLMKRRKAVEDLLKRHQMLLEEEKKIKELEMAANAIIMQLPSQSSSTKEPKIKSHLKEAHQKILPLADNKSSDETCQIDSLPNTEKSNYQKKDEESEISTQTNLSEYSFNTFYENAKSTINKIKNKKDAIESLSSNLLKGSSVEYSEDFESEKQLIETKSNENNISSISELIEDFTQIEHGISMFSKQFEETTSDNTNLDGLSVFSKPPSSLNLKSQPIDKSSVTSENLNLGEIVSKEDIQTENVLTSSHKGEDKSSPHLIQISSAVSDTLGFSEQEENVITSEQITGTEITEETPIIEETLSELSKHSEQSTQDYADEASKSPSKKLLPFETQNKGCIHSETISSEKESLISTSEKEPEIDINLPEENLSSDISIPIKSEHSKTLIEDQEQTGQLTQQTQSDENLTLDILSVPNKSQHSELQIEDEVQTKYDSSETNKFVSSAAEIIDSTPSEKIDEDHILGDILNEKLNFDMIPSETEESNDCGHSELDKNESIPKRDETGLLESMLVESETQSISIHLISSENDTLSTPVIRGDFEEKNQPLIQVEGMVSAEFDQHLKKANLESIPKEEILDSPMEEENQNVIVTSSQTEETYKDIPSIETNTELYISEIKTDDTTTKDISEIKDLELNLENEDILLEYDESSGQQESSETVETSILNANSKHSQKKSNSSPEKNLGHSFDENSVKILSDGTERRIDVISSEDVSINRNIVGGVEDEISLIVDKSVLGAVGKDTVEHEEEEIFDETHREKSAEDESSSDSYTDDFEDDKDDISISSIQGNAVESASNSTPKIEEDKKVSEIDDVLMVKIDLTMDPSNKEAKIVVINENSNISSKPNTQQIIEKSEHDEDKSKSPIQQRVSEILANTVGSQKSPRDKNTRYQDYYVTTYEDITPVNSPESVSPVKSNQLASINTFNNEAEELLKKQLAIELEIKQLEQQQKGQLPLVYIREIPNKPPPPYTPPSAQSNAKTILPNRADDLKEICRYSAKVLYNAYLSNNLHAVTFSETDFKTINKTKSSKDCCLFVFDLCREIAENHYKRFQTKKVPAWLKLPEEARLILGKPYNYHQLENHIHTKVKELLGFEKINIKENSIIRWSKKKKDHVDEILVLESQAEEQEWLNYDNDELMVKNEVTDAIFDILLSETVGIYKNIFSS